MTRYYLRATHTETRIVEYGGPGALGLRWSEARSNVDPFWVRGDAFKAKDAHELTCRIDGCEVVVVRVGPLEDR
jgi:hypothetical protein